MLSDASMLFRFASGLPPFLRESTSAPQARLTLRRSLQFRAEAFLQLIEHAVFPFTGNPYRWLLQRAGLDLPAVRHLVHSCGLDSALERLLDAGVYLTIDEFKGRLPLRRGNQHFPLPSFSCDNPILTAHFAAASGGSSGRPRRLVIDLDLLRYECDANLLFCDAAAVSQAQFALWRPVPPGSAGIKRALSAARLRHHFARWFTQVSYHPLRPDSKSWAVTTTALAASRLAGRAIPSPEFVPLPEAVRVARWMATVRRAKLLPHLDAPVSAAVLVAQAAAQAGLDLSGSFIRTGSEPLTPARAAVLASAGCRFLNHYSIAETGPVGLACTDASHVDDVHFLAGKLGLVSRAGFSAVSAPPHIPALFLTTLLAAAPKIMINVESGDTAQLELRQCSCIFSELGYHTHLHTVRSYEKLTAGGMHFLGSSLLRLIEEVLPARFGGNPADYQFEETDDAGRSAVQLRVHPRLGPLDDARLLDAVLSGLACGGPADLMMSGQWRQGNVLRILRQPPLSTTAAKILPLLFRPRS